MGPDTGEDTRVFDKDCTVILNVGDNQRVKAIDVIRDIDSKYGKGSAYACIPKSGDCFEITLVNKHLAEKLTEGVIIADKNFDCGLIYSDIMVVSFMHLPAYITDTEIKVKLASYGIALKGRIKRRYYRGTRCADGTRYVKCEFPKHIKSLNYLMKFDTVHGPQMFRVKHNNQTKVCSICLSDEHLRKDCPEFKCFRCGVQGHTKNTCVEPRCDGCTRYPVNCVCDAGHADATDANDTDNDAGYMVETDVDDVDTDAEVSNENGRDADTVEDAMDLSGDMGAEVEIPGVDDDSSIDRSGDDSPSQQTTDFDIVATVVDVHNSEQSSFLVDFSTPTVVGPDEKILRDAKGETFTPEAETPVDRECERSEPNYMSSSEDENMDCLDDMQSIKIDRRQKRKNFDKSSDYAKRKKDVTKAEIESVKETNEQDDENKH